MEQVLELKHIHYAETKEDKISTVDILDQEIRSRKKEVQNLIHVLGNRHRKGIKQIRKRRKLFLQKFQLLFISLYTSSVLSYI